MSDNERADFQKLISSKGCVNIAITDGTATLKKGSQNGPSVELFGEKTVPLFFKVEPHLKITEVITEVRHHVYTRQKKKKKETP